MTTTEPKPNPGPATQPRQVLARRGLAWKIFKLTFPLIFLIVLITQVGVGYLDYLSRLETYHERAELTARLTAEALSRPVWNLDRSVFESQIRAIERDNSFRHARLLDEKGNVIFALGAKPQGSRVIAASAPVLEPGGGSRIGAFELYISTEQLAANAYRQAAIGLAAILVLLVGFFFTLHTALRRLVKRPLDRLLEAMGRVERKDWQKVDWRGDDEIGQVTGAFNRMVDGLRSGDEAKRLLAQLEEAQQDLLDKNKQLTKANRLILESIQYARRIQTAMLPDKEALGGAVSDIHVCWEPLHMVGGDYFWLERFGDKSLLAVMDCTGHGVPGAFMTLVVASALDRILHDNGVISPAGILTMLDEMVRARLRQDRPDSDSDDGLEAAICVWDSAERSLTFAGAGLPLLCAQDGQVAEVKGDRGRLGYRTLPPASRFTDHRLDVAPGASYYLITDGIPDHMGGEPPRLMGRRRLRRIIAQVADQPMTVQLEAIEAELLDYRGEQPRRDDMTLIGFTPL